MQNPGSNPDIPEEADITFEMQWDRNKPGVKRAIAYLELDNGRRLVVFPDRTWKPPTGRRIKCVLWPIRNAAVAAPVGGIPDEEYIEPTGLPAYEGSSHMDGRSPISAQGGSLEGTFEEIADLLEPIDTAYSQITEGMEQLDQLLSKLDGLVRHVRVDR